MITSDRLQRLLDIVERSLAEPNLNGEQLAGQAHLSRFHFDRLAAATLGESPGHAAPAVVDGARRPPARHR